MQPGVAVAPPWRGRIVLFGATGYTGELTAEALRAAASGRCWPRATARGVRALAAELGGLD